MEIPVEKNKEYVVEIIDQGYEGEGIAKIDSYTIFVKDAIKGEKCRILIVKITTSHAFAKIVEILNSAEHRVKPDCKTYTRCGGCELRHMEYEQTLKLKQDMVQNLINKTLESLVQVNKTLGMGNPYYYRNKAQYPLGFNKQGNPAIGIYAQRSHEIIPIQHCYIQNEISQKIAYTIFDFAIQNNISIYNEKTQKGILRHIVIKIGRYTNQIMCILVTNTPDFKEEDKLISVLTEQYPEITTIIKNINSENTNVILGKENIALYGNGFITDYMGEYKFNISPMSFYQVNPVQAEALYEIAIEFAQLEKEDILFDLYCGIGTIGIFASSYVKKVYGIEIIEEAVKDAKENAKQNKIENIEFMAGDVEKVFNEFIYQKKILPDAIIVDPPRKGLDNTTIENILKIHPKKLVYISCNPATMVRDIKKMEEIYELKQVQPVDMFPFTKHVECIAMLELKNK